MTPSRVGPSNRAPWPPVPASPTSPDLLQPYLEHYRAWLGKDLHPHLERHRRQLAENASRNALMEWVASEWSSLVPRGHGTDAAPNGMGKLAGHLAGQEWFTREVNAECASFLGLAAAARPHTEDDFTGVIRVVCERIAPLHVAESRVRMDAAKRLAAHSANLPQAARAIESSPVLKLQNLKGGLGQAACRDAMLQSVGSAEEADAASVRPPFERMQRAWLSGVWPGRRDGIRKLAQHEGPDAGAAMLAWVETFEELHPWLRIDEAPARKTRLRDDVSDDDRASWSAYIEDQIDQLAQFVYPNGPARGSRPELLPGWSGDYQEIVADGVLCAIQRMKGWECQPAAERRDHEWMGILNSGLKSARMDFFRMRRREINMEEGDDFRADEQEVYYPADSDLRPVHVHVGMTWLARRAKNDRPASRPPGVDEVITECLKNGAECHTAAIDAALRGIIHVDGIQALADEVQFHLTRSPHRFLAVGDSPGPELAQVGRRLAKYVRDLDTGPEPRPEPSSLVRRAFGKHDGEGET